MAMVWQQSLPTQYRGASDPDLRACALAAKKALGSRLVILGHHYQQDAVIEFADFVGDSFELSRKAAQQKGIEFVIFCGVHFMAESADILTAPDVKVILPDLGAGCSMADMANLDQTLECWEQLEDALPRPDYRPHHLHEQLRRHQSLRRRARRRSLHQQQLPQVLEWALQGGANGLSPGQKVKVLFFPDQHLGRNTASAMGYPLDP